ncbi:allene oxide synthase 1, chloroplastic [Cryptomeria japonica]|uniref:allene oxide synthase 1, chloroplastic n=1 Tax=Cryptomeria japonica TaxID=3369 RepID=UPI0027DA4AD5|nr:allene oxide synthase 1, chloroplastic [Cryptomeria japonica]
MATSSAEGVQEVPGSYGLPVIGAIADRFDYFVKEGVDAFFKTRIEKYNSTVFRVNMPPGPPLFPDPRVIILLDAKSFPVLFDLSKVEKKNVFTGVYMPSTDFTGGYRVLSYLDPSEENHTKLKNFCFHVLKTNATKWFPEFERATGELWAKLDKQFAESGKAEFTSENLQMCFNFLCRSVLNRDPAYSGPASLGTNGPTYVVKWIGLQLAPIASTGVLPKILEEVTIHAAPLPFLLVREDYNKVYNFFWTYGKEALDAAEQQFGLKRDEACHNLVFSICFNTFGGMFVFFPILIQHISAAGKQLHADLAEEVRSAIKDNGGLNMTALESMVLVRSTVYEALRIEPPVPFQYGHAKEDLVVESHDGKYAVKKGEMLGGYQPFATRDPKVFDNPEEFLPRRFMAEEGEKLLKYVLWSNGPETEETTVNNKQCAGKNFVVMISRLLVAHLFAHYDSFEIDPSTTTKVVFTSLQKATS